jgi:hypothetical protein
MIAVVDGARRTVEGGSASSVIVADAAKGRGKAVSEN